MDQVLRFFIATFFCGLLAACGDPLATTPKFSAQDVADPSAGIAIAAQPADDEALIPELRSELAKSDEDAAKMAPQDEAAPAKRGFLGMLGRSSTLTDEEQDVVKASHGGSDARAARKAKRKSARRGLPTVSEVPPGTILPYGQLARVCGLPKRAYGKQIAQYPETKPKHRLYDSEPGNTAPHTFFLTGFDDGCARQFTASIAMFGSVEMHELLRYGRPAKEHPYSTTDKAYETLKTRVCRVPAQKPCGAKADKLHRNTVFVSIYERFGSNQSWRNLLIHDGAVLAEDSKSGG